MDAHYDQVMQARAKLDGAPARRYFAYSTILDRAAFLEWRAQHGYGFFELPAGEQGEALDVALVFDFPSRWWGGRVAGLAAAPAESVFGLVFEIAGVDWPIVQHKEGVITGVGAEIDVRVRLGSGAIVGATAFATNPQRRSDAGEVSAKFVAALLAGARAAGLPESYLARVEKGAR